MNAAMVRATLAGTKEETRRVCDFKHVSFNHSSREYTWINNRGVSITDKDISFACQIAQPGSLIWVRETFRELFECETGAFHSYDYYADMPEEFHLQYKRKWKPSIHMPLKACRLFLKTNDVRLERLQNITDRSALREGILTLTTDFTKRAKIPPLCFDYLRNEFRAITPKYSFKTLWISIYGEDSWNANPWVWVIDFKRIEKPAQ